MTTPAAAASPPPTVDPQDPLPDPSWLWRRVFVFATGGALLAFGYVQTAIIGQVAMKGSETAIAGLIKVAERDQALIAILILFYMVAPSAEQITKMLATASAWKKGVSTSSISRAVAPDGSTAEASNSAGLAAAAPPPPPPPAPADDADAAPTSRTS